MLARLRWVLRIQRQIHLRLSVQHAADPGTLALQVRVYHSNAGAHPAWFLEEVRVRRQDDPRWTIFPCNRWLAVHQDDG